MRAVNLLPKEVQRASAQKPVAPVLISILLVAVSGFVLWKMHGDLQSTIKSQQADIDAINSVPPKIAPEVTQAQRDASLQEGPRITALDSALKTRIPWDNLLRQVSLVVPDDVTLRTLTLTAPVAGDTSLVAPPSAKTDQMVTIEGSSYSQDGVARFLARLDVVGALKNVTLTDSTVVTPPADSASSSGDSGSGGGLVNFTISADVVPPGQATTS
jgi:Tfp pilus assembly protein PilN